MGDDTQNTSTGKTDDNQVDDKIQDMNNNNKGDLEILNTAITEINQLSSLVYHSRVAFRQHLQVSKEHLDKLFSSQRRHIHACRPYYKAQEDLAKAQGRFKEVQDEYRRACLEEEDAKENAEVAEKALLGVLAATADPDPDVLANLNKATKWVAVCTDAREEARVHKARGEEECARLSAELNLISKQLYRSLYKAKPYFELRDRMKQQLDSQVEEVQQQQQKLSEAKEKYRAVFASLDVINCQMASDEGMDDPIMAGHQLSHFMDIDSIDTLPLEPYSKNKKPTSKTSSSSDGDATASTTSSVTTSVPSNLDFPSDLSDIEDDLCNLSDEGDNIELSLGSLSLDEVAWKDMHNGDNGSSPDPREKLDHFSSAFEMNL